MVEFGIIINSQMEYTNITHKLLTCFVIWKDILHKSLFYYYHYFVILEPASRHSEENMTDFGWWVLIPPWTCLLQDMTVEWSCSSWSENVPPTLFTTMSCSTSRTDIWGSWTSAHPRTILLFSSEGKNNQPFFSLYFTWLRSEAIEQRLAHF